jgi:hypothetical protein
MKTGALLLALIVTPHSPEADHRAGSIDEIRRGADLRDAPTYTAPPIEPLDVSGLEGFPKAPAGGGWRKTKSSLLLFGPEGDLINEIGLGEWTEDMGEGLKARRVMRGGASENGRFAWHWQKVETVRPGRSEILLGSTMTLVYLGTSGQTLWNNDRADTPEDLEPLYQSRLGETAVTVERSTHGWTISAYAFTGNVLASFHTGPRLLDAALTRNGRFITALYSGVDTALIYTFYDLKTHARKDISADKTQLGRAFVQDDGTVLSGKKTIHRFP